MNIFEPQPCIALKLRMWVEVLRFHPVLYFHAGWWWRRVARETEGGGIQRQQEQREGRSWWSLVSDLWQLTWPLQRSFLSTHVLLAGCVPQNTRKYTEKCVVESRACWRNKVWYFLLMHDDLEQLFQSLVFFFFVTGEQNLDAICLSTYRTACKLRFVQKRCNCESPSSEWHEPKVNTCCSLM